MSLGGFTLADRLGAKTVPCRVSGCTRTWLQLSSKALALGGGTAPADAGDPGAGMCDPCRTKLKTLSDQQRRCDRPGCENTWTWPVTAQLEAFATKRPAPRRLCTDCEGRLASLDTKEIACAIPGCARKAVLTPKQQLLMETAAPPPAPEEVSADAATAETPAADEAEGQQPQGKKQKKEPPKGITFQGVLCAECADVAPRIKDRAVNCGIRNCNRKWIWKADDQIQAFAAGKPNEPPRRMCDPCRAEFGKLVDRDVRCRTSGCKKTWVWNRYDQLDACVAGKPAPKAPERMCESCFTTFQGLKDVERPCRRSGCKGTWLDKRGAQLARAVRGKVGDPYPRYCTNCEKELGDLQDREITCKTDGCNGTWTWSKEQQLAAGVRPKKFLDAENGEPAAQLAAAPAEDENAAVAATEAAAAETAVAEGATDEGDAPAVVEGAPVAAVPEAAKDGKKKRRRNNRNKKRREPQPPDRRCSACAEFLSSKKTLEIPCSQCATPIYWPPESQLQTHLGNWAMPSLCGACKRDATEAARQAAKEAIRAQHEHGHSAPGAAAENAEAPGVDGPAVEVEVPVDASGSETPPASDAS